METQRINLESNGKVKCSGDYYFYVHNFNQTGVTFSSLNTKVNVFKNGVKIQTFTPNDGAYKHSWIVFKIINQETITEINQYADDCSTIISEIDDEATIRNIKIIKSEGSIEINIFYIFAYPVFSP